MTEGCWRNAKEVSSTLWAFGGTKDFTWKRELSRLWRPYSSNGLWVPRRYRRLPDLIAGPRCLVTSWISSLNASRGWMTWSHFPFALDETRRHGVSGFISTSLSYVDTCEVMTCKRVGSYNQWAKLLTAWQYSSNCVKRWYPSLKWLDRNSRAGLSGRRKWWWCTRR